LFDIYEAFLSRYKSYTGIQKAAIPVVSQGSNCLIVAPTGSGKTEAAVLPLLDKMSRSASEEGIWTLYITPLRALNRDMLGRLESLCAALRISVAVRHGDTAPSERARQVRKAPMLLITTPETLQSMLPTKGMGMALRNVKAVVVDEIHELVYSKRGAQLSLALERLEEIAPGYQRIGISATIGDTESAMKFLCGARECRLADVDVRKSIEVKVELPQRGSRELKSFSEKFGLDKAALARLESIAAHIASSTSTLVFANTRQVVEALGSRLIYLDKEVHFGGIGVHHSSLDRDERIAIEDSFKERRIKSIIATSSLELGIDIGSIGFVVQYGSPRQALRLMQRVGRSGHREKGVSKGAVIATNVLDAIEAIAVYSNAKAGRIETLKPNASAQDVLANQICGIALDKGTIGVDPLLAMIRRSFLYSDFDREKLNGLLEFMSKQSLIGFDGKVVTSGARTRMYYYEHLSVIPDVKRIAIRSVADNRLVSMLDERFVSSSLEEGETFITKGLPWKVVSIDNDVVSVEPSAEVEAAVPDWRGEDIPVSYGVAQRVMRLLGRFDDENHCGDAGADAEIEHVLKEQKECFAIAQGRMTAELLDSYAVLHTYLGTQANEALARLLAYVLSSRSQISINIRASPYSVFIETGKGRDVVDALKGLDPERVEKVLEGAITSTELFRYRFIVIAKLFGIIDKSAAISASMARRLIQVLRDSPVYAETVRELMQNYFDTNALRDFFKEIASGKTIIDEVKLEHASPITRIMLDAAYYTKELVAPLRPNSELVESFAEHVLVKKIELLCTYCGFSFTRNLSDIRNADKILCPNCESPMLSLNKPEYAEVVKRRLSGKKRMERDQKMLKEMMRYASLFDSYGGRAAIALSVYGIGPETASRALMMLRREENQFLMDLLEAQKNYVRTKKYWSA
jgi:ATP-dependent Lhr-like helicase